MKHLITVILKEYVHTLYNVFMWAKVMAKLLVDVLTDDQTSEEQYNDTNECACAPACMNVCE